MLNQCDMLETIFLAREVHHAPIYLGLILMIKLSIDHNGQLDRRSHTIGSLISMINLSIDKDGQLKRRSRTTGSLISMIKLSIDNNGQINRQS